MNYWLVSETSFVPNLKRLRSQETVYTIGNGYFCTRGSFEEGFPGDMPATLLFGVFDDIPIAKEELANAPDWTLIQLFIDGERFRLDRGTLLDYQRTLDIQRGIVSRSVRWESPKGARLHIQSERFASLADEHVGAIRYSVTLEESQGQNECTIAVWSTINAAEGNYDVLHWECAEQGHQDDVIWLHSITKHSKVDLAQAMSFTTTKQDYHKELVDSDTAPSIRFYGTLAPGETFSADKIVTMYTSRDAEDPIASAIHNLQDLLAVTHVSPEANTRASSPVDEDTIELSPTVTPTYDALLTHSSAAWQQFWQIADIIIEGDEKAQIGTRYNIYQLRINVSAHDDRYSVAAKGLTGFGYRGHIFHDTEIFMLPFYTYVMPAIARNLLMYRYHLLPGARQKAANNGYEGAQYPWESTLDGEEATPPAIIHPESGEVISVLNGFIELHITASIAHAVWQYWRVTGDDEFMRDYGAEILLSTAMFWASRAEEHEQHHEYEITNVIGPDEWHEHVNNNVYTNIMARYNIRYGLAILAWLQTTSPRKAQVLEQQLKLTPQTVEHWKDVADHLRIDQDLTTKVLEQFDGFFKLEPFDQTQYAGRKDSYQGILGVHEVQRYRIIKQADVLMLLTVLKQEFDYETKKANWDYYYPITDHDYGSSLTPALHVILACELGLLDIAYQMFMKGALVDLENLRGNTPEGIHAACSGAVWQATILGFAGLRINDDGYTTAIQWPDGWTRLAFSFYYKGELIHIDLRK
ncbi:MAG: glycoside hydrolase family 65 protein [Chloroflexi bacterium]|nr:MAG: glycoside hydrolase family 65 protein [Chloroflexota bacterium]